MHNKEEEKILRASECKKKEKLVRMRVGYHSTKKESYYCTCTCNVLY